AAAALGSSGLNQVPAPAVGHALPNSAGRLQLLPILEPLSLGERPQRASFVKRFPRLHMNPSAQTCSLICGRDGYFPQPHHRGAMAGENGSAVWVERRGGNDTWLVEADESLACLGVQQARRCRRIRGEGEVAVTVSNEDRLSVRAERGGAHGGVVVE